MLLVIKPVTLMIWYLQVSTLIEVGKMTILGLVNILELMFRQL